MFTKVNTVLVKNANGLKLSVASKEEAASRWDSFFGEKSQINKIKHKKKRGVLCLDFSNLTCENIVHLSYKELETLKIEDSENVKLINFENNQNVNKVYVKNSKIKFSRCLKESFNIYSHNSEVKFDNSMFWYLGIYNTKTKMNFNCTHALTADVYNTEFSEINSNYMNSFFFRLNTCYLDCFSKIKINLVHSVDLARNLDSNTFEFRGNAVVKETKIYKTEDGNKMLSKIDPSKRVIQPVKHERLQEFLVRLRKTLVEHHDVILKRTDLSVIDNDFLEAIKSSSKDGGFNDPLFLMKDYKLAMLDVVDEIKKLEERFNDKLNKIEVLLEQKDYDFDSIEEIKQQKSLLEKEFNEFQRITYQLKEKQNPYDANFMKWELSRNSGEYIKILEFFKSHMLAKIKHYNNKIKDFNQEDLKIEKEKALQESKLQREWEDKNFLLEVLRAAHPTDKITSRNRSKLVDLIQSYGDVLTDSLSKRESENLLKLKFLFDLDTIKKQSVCKF